MHLSATTRYLAAWAFAALGSLAVLLLSSDLPAFDLRTAITFALIITAAELIVIEISVGRSGAVFTLSEAAIVAGLLLLDPLYVVLGAGIALLLAHLPRRLSADKVLFNVSQMLVATTGAALVMQATPDLGPIVGQRSLAAALLAMGVYAAINLLAFRGLLVRIAGPDGVADFVQQAPLTLASMLGTVAVGSVAAALYEPQPLMILFLLVPILAIQIAGRSSLQAAELVETIRAERDRLEQVVVGASDGILLLDRNASILVWSPALEELTGVTAAEAVGAPVATILTDKRRESVAAVRGHWVIDDHHQGPTRFRLDARWRSSDRELRDVQEDHALLFDDRGHCVGDVALIRDVTRESELERLRADFVARVSHELRTPLTPIRGYVQLLLRRGDRMSPEQRQEALGNVLSRTDHLGEVVEDLLLVTQLERGELDGVVTLIDGPLDEVVRDAVAAVAERQPERILQVTIDPDAPTAKADPPRVAQIVTELVENALLYSPPDRPVSIALDGKDDRLRIRVIDQGPGIPRSQRERVFERFQRLEDPLTMRTSGVGLGLFISRRLAEAMDGQLELETFDGVGCTFTVSLPLADDGHG